MWCSRDTKYNNYKYFKCHYFSSYFPPLADVLTLTLWKIFLVVRLLFAPLQRCSWGSCTSSRLLFSPTLSDIWDPRSARPRPRLWPLSFTWVHREHCWSWNLACMFSNHVNRSTVLLPKLTSFFHSAADVTRRLLCERGDLERHLACV